MKIMQTIIFELAKSNNIWESNSERSWTEILSLSTWILSIKVASEWEIPWLLVRTPFSYINRYNNPLAHVITALKLNTTDNHHWLASFIGTLPSLQLLYHYLLDGNVECKCRWFIEATIYEQSCRIMFMKMQTLFAHAYSSIDCDL